LKIKMPVVSDANSAVSAAPAMVSLSRGRSDRRAGEGEQRIHAERADLEEEHAGHHTQRRAGLDAEDAGVGHRVARPALHDRARHGQRRANHDGHRRTRHAQRPDDQVLRVICVEGEHSLQNSGQGDVGCTKGDAAHGGEDEHAEQHEDAGHERRARANQARGAVCFSRRLPS
jgi:hypothetical protein